jgi:hypothetical protein
MAARKGRYMALLDDRPTIARLSPHVLSDIPEDILWITTGKECILNRQCPAKKEQLGERRGQRW